MAVSAGAISKMIKILNDRDKEAPNKAAKEKKEPGKSGEEKPLEAYKGGKNPTPTGKSNEFNFSGGLEAYLGEAQKRGLDVSNVKSAGELQSKVYDSLMGSKEGQNIIKNMWKEYGDTGKGSSKVLPDNLSKNDLANLKSSFVDEKLGGRTQMILGKIPEKQKTPPPVQETKRKREYTGEPVYLPGVKGMLNEGTITNALVGFLSNTGEFDPIEETDYGRYAVPKWAQESMATGGADEYLKTKLGAYYKGTKKIPTQK